MLLSVQLVCYVPEGSTEPVSVEAMEINYMTFYAYNGEQHHAMIASTLPSASGSVSQKCRIAHLT